jgi:hypothetical protein
MEALKEITVWDSPQAPNHTYLLDGTNLVAYIKQGDTEPFYFKNPIKGFSKSGRKFETLKVNPFKDWAKLLKAHIDVEAPPTWIKQVQGSKPGVFYTVNTDENTCTCPGFTFRGACKHTKELETT